MFGACERRVNRHTMLRLSLSTALGQTLPMDLSYSADDETFRKEIRTWLEEHLPAGWFEPGFEMSAADRKAFNETWPSTLFDGGWICATWPVEYGGKGLTTMQGVVLTEEFA